MKFVALIFLCPLIAFASGEYWISPTPTSPLPSIQAAFPVGSIENPWDGSTYMRFDAVMGLLPTNCLIHLMAGQFQTLGIRGYGLKSHQRAVGAGMDITTVLLIASAPTLDWIMGTQSPYLDIGITVSDMTLDGGFRPGMAMRTINGLNLHGSGNTIQRVKLINTCSFTDSFTNYVEAWGLIIDAAPFAEAHGNVIEDCVVQEFYGNYYNNLSAIGLMENNSGKTINNIITQNGTNYILGIYPGSHGSIMTGNILTDVAVGVHYDSGTGMTNDLISLNQFIRCSCAIDLANGYFCDSTFTENMITLTNDGSGRLSCEAFFFHQSPSQFKNIVVTGNTVTTTGNFQSQRFIVGNAMTGITVIGNRVAAELPSLFIGTNSGVRFVDNFDSDGNDYTNITTQ